ncbi:hypothetical protein ACQ4PT_062337 [Festuca glaucescens]
MAQFVLGLTKTAVEGTVMMVKSAMEEEAKLKAQVSQDLVFITGEFEAIHSVLKTASGERAKDEAVGTWVRHLRDLAFDVEDCAEFVVHLDNKPGWWWRVVPSLVPSCFSDLVPLVLSRQPLDEAAAELKLLKARVEEVTQRNTRYNLITGSGSGSSSSAEHPATPSACVPPFHFLREVWGTAGSNRGLAVDNLHDLITSDDRDLQVISVWSSAGGDPGMTSILGKAYGDPEICQKFKNRAWVKLMHPFNPDEFRKTLLAQFYPDEQQVDDPMKQVNQEMYLIILEQVSSVVEWDAISKCLPVSKNGSRIIVSTQQLWIALMCAGEPYRVSELRRSSDGHSLCAFYTKNNNNRMEKARDWIGKNTLFGRESESKSLKARLKGDVTSFPVWGIAGVGKSALVRTHYYNEVLKKKGKDADFVMFSWVDVPDQFNLTDLSRRLLLDFYSDDLEANESAAVAIMEGLDTIQECRKILHRHKCLLVIDGLRLPHDWDSIKDAFLPDDDAKTTGSRIVVITNEKKAADHVICHVPGSTVLNVKGLPDHAAKSLFAKVAPKHIKGSTPADMARLSKLTMAKSGSLPKVIDALGRELDSATNAWHASTILDKYTTLDSLRGLYSWMQSYFDDCSDSLKPCIFYLSVFPVGQNIRRRRLVTRWIAEGYARDRFGSTSGDWESSRDRYGSTADENGEKFFSDLTQLSIIQQLTTNNVYQVNGFFHGYIISRPMEDNLVLALEGFCKPNSQRTGQHLTIRSSWDRDSNVYDSIDFTRLRSLTVFGSWVSFLVSKRMKLLRVLDLEDTSGLTDKELEKIVKLVTRLKFLSLRGCREISQLPDSMDDMRQLQTVDVRHTSIVKLPLDICKLPKLQYIHAGNTEPWYEGDGIVTVQSAADTMPPQDVDGRPTILPPTSSSADNVGVELPTGIGSLTVLHTLGVVQVHGASGEAFVKELKNGKLPRLHKLKVSGINRGNINDFFSAISRHRHLESLSVRLDDDVQHDFILPELPKTLRKLKLYGNILNLPVWIQKSDKIKCFDIEMTITTGEDLLPLEKLVKRGILRRLCVKLIEDGDIHLIIPDHQSCKFQNLKIDCSSKANVTFAESKLVEVLKVKCSGGSDLRFSGLENLKSLKEVWLMGAFSDTLKQELAHQLSKHPKREKPVLKLVRPRTMVC